MSPCSPSHSKNHKGLEDARRRRGIASRTRELEAAVARHAGGERDDPPRQQIAEDTRNEILADAKARPRVLGAPREEIGAEKDKAMAEIRGQVAELALAAAGKLVRREMDGPTQKRIVEEFLAEVKPATPAKSSRS